MVGGFFVRESLKNARDALRRAKAAALEGDAGRFRLAVAELEDAAYRLKCAANGLVFEGKEKADAG